MRLGNPGRCVTNSLQHRRIFLILYPKVDYFKRYLRNDTWLKRAKDLEKQFPEVLHMFTRFMKLKYQLLTPIGGVQVRGIDMSTKALVTSMDYQYHRRDVNLVVLDLREVQRVAPMDVIATVDLV